MSPIYVSQILSYNVNIQRNLNQTVRQKIVAVNRKFFECTELQLSGTLSRLFKRATELQICSQYSVRTMKYKIRGYHIHLMNFLFTFTCLQKLLYCYYSVVLEKKIFFNFVNVFSLFHYYLPLEKGGALYLNKLESSSPKDGL